MTRTVNTMTFIQNQRRARLAAFVTISFSLNSFFLLPLFIGPPLSPWCPVPRTTEQAVRALRPSPQASNFPPTPPTARPGLRRSRSIHTLFLLLLFFAKQDKKIEAYQLTLPLFSLSSSQAHATPASLASLTLKTVSAVTFSGE